jgi:stress-induced morphogen
MAMAALDIQSFIEEALPGAQVTIEDLAGDGEHYTAHVRSELFVGKSRLQQHKMVYDALGGRVGGQLHALSVKTYLPD